MTSLDKNDSEDKHAQPKVIKLFDKNEPSKDSKVEKPKVAPKPTPPPPQPKAEKRPEPTKSEAPKPKKSKIQATILPGMLENEFKVNNYEIYSEFYNRILARICGESWRPRV